MLKAARVAPLPAASNAIGPISTNSYTVADQEPRSASYFLWSSMPDAGSSTWPRKTSWPSRTSTGPRSSGCSPIRRRPLTRTSPVSGHASASRRAGPSRVLPDVHAAAEGDDRRNPSLFFDGLRKDEPSVLDLLDADTRSSMTSWPGTTRSRTEGRDAGVAQGGPAPRRPGVDGRRPGDDATPTARARPGGNGSSRRSSAILPSRRRTSARQGGARQGKDVKTFRDRRSTPARRGCMVPQENRPAGFDWNSARSADGDRAAARRSMRASFERREVQQARRAAEDLLAEGRVRSQSRRADGNRHGPRRRRSTRRP